MAGNQAHLFIGQRGTKARNRRVESGLMQRNDIHIPFRKDKVITFCLSRQIERKQVAAFMKNRRFRRVKVFRLGIIHDAPAERNHLSAHVDNRKHDAVTETVVNVSPLTAGS